MRLEKIVFGKSSNKIKVTPQTRNRCPLPYYQSADWVWEEVKVPHGKKWVMPKYGYHVLWLHYLGYTVWGYPLGSTSSHPTLLAKAPKLWMARLKAENIARNAWIIKEDKMIKCVSLQMKNGVYVLHDIAAFGKGTTEIPPKRRSTELWFINKGGKYISFNPNGRAVYRAGVPPQILTDLEAIEREHRVTGLKEVEDIVPGALLHGRKPGYC